MRFRFLLLAGLLLNGLLPARAQSFRWAQGRPFTYTFNAAYLNYAVAAQPGGGAWWVGLDQFHLNYSVALGSLQLVRFSPTGAAQAPIRIGGNVTASRLLAEPSGGLYLLGSFKDSLRFEGGLQLTQPSGSLVSFLAALDSTGRCRWVQEVVAPAGSASNNATATALALDPRGGVLLGVSSGLGSYIQSLDAQTGALTATVPQLDVPYVTSVAADRAGNLFVAGGCAEPTSRFNGQLYPSPPGMSYATYVACYDAARTPRWVHYVEDITCPAPQVAADGQGGVYFMGQLFGAYAFGALHAAGPVQGLTGDFFLTHLDAATGTFQWLREVPQVNTGNLELAPLQNLAVDAQGRAYMTASMRGTIPWDSVTTSASASFSSYELLVICYEPTGDLAWAKTTNGSSGSTQSLALSVAPVAGGVGVLLTGRTSPSFQRGAIVRCDTLSLRSGVGIQLPFVARLDAPARPTGVAAEVGKMPTFSLFPNPATGADHLTLRGTAQAAGPLHLELRDAVGRLVLTRAYATRAASGDEILPLPATLAPGVYWLRVETTAGAAVVRLVR